MAENGSKRRQVGREEEERSYRYRKLITQVFFNSN